MKKRDRDTTGEEGKSMPEAPPKRSDTELLAELRYNQAHGTSLSLEEVLLLLAQGGRTLYGIADELGVSHTTAKRYLALYKIAERVA